MTNATFEGRSAGGLTTWAKYHRLPGGRKKLPRFDSQGAEVGRQPRGGFQATRRGKEDSGVTPSL